MEVYTKIKKNIKEYLSNNSNEELAKLSNKIIDIYIDKLCKTLFECGRAYVLPIRSLFYINVKPLMYINHSMYKNMLVSPLNANYIFEVKMRSIKVKKNKFTFKSMSKLKYFFLNYSLKTNRVYKLIDNYEKSIL